MWFLLEYDRNEGKLQKLTPFPESDHAEAMTRLAALERSQLEELHEMLRTGQRPRMEYVVLGADSVDAIRATHPNYFESLRDLAEKLDANARKSASGLVHRDIVMTT